MIRAVLFDADGVLNSGASTDYSTLGIQKKDMEPFWAEFCRHCLIGKQDTKQLIEAYIPRWGYTGTVDDFLQFWHESERALHTEVMDAIATIRQRGIMVCLATNQDQYRLQYMK